MRQGIEKFVLFVSVYFPLLCSHHKLPNLLPSLGETKTELKLSFSKKNPISQISRKICRFNETKLHVFEGLGPKGAGPKPTG